MAITFDAATDNGASPTSLTVSHTIGAGSDKLLVVGVSVEVSSPVVSVTVGGTAMTQAVNVAQGQLNGYIFYSLDADITAGANSVVVTSNDAITGTHVTVASFFGSKQDVPTDTAETTGVASTSLTHALTTGNGGMHFDVGGHERFPRTMTLQTGQTQLSHRAAQGHTSVHGYELHASGATADESVVSDGTADDMIFVSVAFDAAAAGGPVTVNPAAEDIGIIGKTFTLDRQIATSVDMLKGSVAITGQTFTVSAAAVVPATANMLPGSITINGKTFDAVSLTLETVNPAAGSVAITGNLFTTTTVGGWNKASDTTTSTWSAMSDKTTSTWSTSTDKTTSTWSVSTDKTTSTWSTSTDKTTSTWVTS